MGIEWPLALFTIVAGTGAGLLAFAGVGEFFAASKKARFFSIIIALILLIAGGCISLLHLGNPTNFMAAATNLFSFSPISLELIFLGLGVIVAIVYLVVVNREGGASKILGICGIVVGVLFCYFSGHGYEVIAVRPAWATPALTLSYCLSALALGGFLFLSLQMVLKDDAASTKKVALIVLVVAALETILFIAYGAMAPLGDNSMVFWICAVVIGGAVAAICGLVAYLKNNMPIAWLGLIAVIVGAVALRAVMWMAGATQIPGFFDLAVNSRSLFPF